MSEKIRIAVVGCGHVGLVIGASFAELGHDVVCVDNDAAKVAALQAGKTLIHEDDLSELMERHGNRQIRFTTDLDEAVRACGVIFIAVGTMPGKNGPGSGGPEKNGETDLSHVEAVAIDMARSIASYKVIVVKSTVPLHTNGWIRRVIERNKVSPELFDVVSNPEFLREGTAVSDFLHPNRIVIGADSDRAADVLHSIYAPLTSGEYYKKEGSIGGPYSATGAPPLLLTSTKSAEIIKHASNAFIALKISFINVVSNLCEVAEANVEQVAEGMGLDGRIGPRFLRPGIGYGGSSFAKDVTSFRSTAENMGMNFGLLTEVEKINLRQKQHFLAKVRTALWTLRRKKLAVLGLAFKGGTDDIRESVAIEIVKMLLAEGCMVVAYDPAAMTLAKDELPPSAVMEYASSAYAAAADADALVILTDWPEFAVLDLPRMKETLRYPIVIDGRNLYDPEFMAACGMTYVSVGRPTAKPAHAPVVAQTPSADASTKQ